MPKCIRCGTRFNLKATIAEYEAEYDGEIEYEDQYPEHDMCADCAITETNSNITAGRDAMDPGWEEHGWLDD